VSKPVTATVYSVTSPRPDTPRVWRATEAVSALGTRMSFAAVAWLLLVETSSFARLSLVVGAQGLAYLAACPAAARVLDRVDAARVAFVVDLVSALAIAVAAFFTADLVVLAVLAGIVGALRGFSDLAKNLLSAAASRLASGDGDGRPRVPPREWLVQPLTLVAGAVLGVVAAWLGPAGALWLVGLSFALSAVLVVVATSPVPATRVVDAISAPTVEFATLSAVEHTDDLVGEGLSDLRRWRPARRLAAVLLLTGLFAQAGAVALVAVWVHGVFGTPRTLGTIGGAAVVGAVGASLVFVAFAVPLVRYVVLALGYLTGAGTVAVVQGMRPVGLLIVVAAVVVGLAVATVSPVPGRLLSQRIPQALRGRVAALAAMVVCLGLVAGNLGGGWIALHTGVRTAIVLAAGCFLVAMVTPVLGHRAWRQMDRGESVVLRTGTPKLSARVSVTLAYADGQWLVEVRKGRALLGTRHPVPPAQALGTLSLLDVPDLRNQVEQALTTDRTEASRHVDRMRSELSDLEAKLAGLTEMVELGGEDGPVASR
jgi:MFS family permease